MKILFSYRFFYVMFFSLGSVPLMLLCDDQAKETPASMIEKARTGCDIANKIINQYQAPKKAVTKEEMLHFLSILSVDAFLDIMGMQTRGFKAMGNVLKDLISTSQTRYVPVIKKRFEMSVAEREENSKVLLEVFNSQEGREIVRKMLEPASCDSLQQMLTAIEEQKEQYVFVKIKMPQYIRAVYDAWELAIKKRLAETVI